MSNVTIKTTISLDEPMLIDMITKSLEDATMYATAEVRFITPRDPQRMPDNPRRKVTGTLKKSIGYEKKSPYHFIIGSGAKGNPIEYAKYLEFGTKRMPARSFLRKTLIDKEREIINIVRSTFAYLTRKYKA